MGDFTVDEEMLERARGPEGFQVDFFGIGSPKSATGWLAACLDEHPEIAISSDKEPNFFVPRMGLPELEPNPGFLRDWDAYVDLWPDEREGLLLGEYSTPLLHNQDASPQLIHAHNPDARLLVMLRDPVDRLYSGYWHVRRHRDRITPRSFQEFLDIEEARRRSRYDELLEPWYGTFGDDAIWVGLVDDVKEDPAALFASVCEHLGVDPTVVPPTLEERVNPQTEKHPAYHALERGVRWAKGLGLAPAIDLVTKSRLGDVVRSAGMSKVETPPLDPEVEARLRKAYAPHVERTAELVGRDLSAWLPDG